MRDADFERLIVEGYERLPEWVREKIKNVALLVEDEPSDEDREAEGLAPDETLLGLYKGVPLTARGDMYGVGMTLPDTITLYKWPIFEVAEEELPGDAADEKFHERVRQIVADTVWHEFAHHFGMDENEVRSREKEKGIEY
jgi:predicted Zn-dependent protease with MMP-like domain